MTFHDLFRVPTRGKDPFAPDRRGDLFPGVVAESRRLHLWEPGDPIPAGDRLLVGVVTWSGYDMNLLDLIDTAADAPDRVDVFDIDARSAEPGGIDRLIPGATAWVTPPFAGLWRGGVLAESAYAATAQQLVARVCRLDPASIRQAMDTVYSRA